jgi:hypothetical protein
LCFHLQVVIDDQPLLYRHGCPAGIVVERFRGNQRRFRKAAAVDQVIQTRTVGIEGKTAGDQTPAVANDQIGEDFFLSCDAGQLPAGLE